MTKYPLCDEYVNMQIRERELFAERENLKEECAEIHDFQEACNMMISARKKLNKIEKIMREYSKG